MTGIELPGPDLVPPCPRRELAKALHELYDAAGRPGLRKIADEVQTGKESEVSRTTVSAMLKGTSLPRWPKWKCVVSRLTVLATPSRDAAVELLRFLELWKAADRPAVDTATPTFEIADVTDVALPSSTTILDRGSAQVTANELARRGHDQHERGWADASDFARLVDYPAFEELAKADFDVRSWITPWRHGAQDVAVGRSPSSAHLPSWWSKALECLGALADPIGFDGSSFTPPDPYLDGFAEALREIWTAAQEQIATNDQTHTLQTQKAPTIIDSKGAAVVFMTPSGLRWGENRYADLTDWLAAPVAAGSAVGSHCYRLEGQIHPPQEGLIRISIYTDRPYDQPECRVFFNGTFSARVYLDEGRPPLALHLRFIGSDGIESQHSLTIR